MKSLMAGNGAPRFSSVSTFISERLAELKVPSMALGVLSKGEVIYEEAFGYANVESKIAATVQTPYSIASITKPMVGTLLAKLASERRIDLSAPVENYLGGAKLSAWTGDTSEVTVARLANHTSGLPFYFQFFFEDEPACPPCPKETIRRYGNVVRPPGASYVYSNIGYGILGFAIEQVTGKSLGEVLQTDLFKPLLMNNAYFAPACCGHPHYAVRYDSAYHPLPHYVTDHPAASEAYCSVQDLLKFGYSHLALVDSPVLGMESKLAMQRPLGPRESEKRYGLGWALSSRKDLLFGHSGGMDGVSTRLCVLPEKEVVIAVLCNADSPLTTEAVTKIFEVIGTDAPTDASTGFDDATPPGAIGNWSGSIQTYERQISFDLVVNESGHVQVFIGGKHSQADIHFEDGDLRGTVNAEIDTTDAKRHPHSIVVDLMIRKDRIVGSATARSRMVTRIGNAVSYAATLDRSG